MQCHCDLSSSIPSRKDKAEGDNRAWINDLNSRTKKEKTTNFSDTRGLFVWTMLVQNVVQTRLEI